MVPSLFPITWSEEAAEKEEAHDAATEAKSLKQISFPEMDDDAAPSSYIAKVLTCLGKWQMKMVDLGNQLDPKNPAMKPFPGFTVGCPSCAACRNVAYDASNLPWCQGWLRNRHAFRKLWASLRIRFPSAVPKESLMALQTSSLTAANAQVWKIHEGHDALMPVLCLRQQDDLKAHFSDCKKKCRDRN